MLKKTPDSLTDYSTLNHEQKKLEKKEGFQRAARFMISRQLANITWLIGVAAGTAATESYDANPWAVGALTAVTVTSVEYPQARYNSKKIKNKLPTPMPVIDEEVKEKYKNNWSKAKYILSRSTREIVGIGTASWQGSGATVEYNNTVGLQNNKIRNAIQATAFGVAIGLWSTPIPPFSQLSDATIDGIDLALSNPIETVAVGGLASLAIYGGLRGVEHLRNNIEVRKQH